MENLPKPKEMGARGSREWGLGAGGVGGGVKERKVTRQQISNAGGSSIGERQGTNFDATLLRDAGRGQFTRKKKKTQKTEGSSRFYPDTSPTTS